VLRHLNSPLPFRSLAAGLRLPPQFSLSSVWTQYRDGWNTPLDLLDLFLPPSAYPEARTELLSAREYPFFGLIQSLGDLRLSLMPFFSAKHSHPLSASPHTCFNLISFLYFCSVVLFPQIASPSMSSTAVNALATFFETTKIFTGWRL